MLDAEIKSQLQHVFEQLEEKIEIVLLKSEHADHGDLQTMLEDVVATSPKLSLRIDGGSKVQAPEFYFEYKGKPTGVRMKGIPGGHEFTSLVVAILNIDGKGKMPEGHIASRIKRLKGPIRLKTYISLSCENCPEVVQALNQMSLIHLDFQHEFIDGGYFQSDIEALKIQGVPSVVHGEKLLHSGRIGILDLIAKLEKYFGIAEPSRADGAEPLLKAEPLLADGANLGRFDVTVVGGGPAGVSAAIYAVRKGLKTALIAEHMGGQVQDTKGIENLISVPYTEGPMLGAQLYQHLTSYPVEVLQNRRVEKIENAALKKITFESGEFLSTQSVIMATGARWRELGIPGEKEFTGRGVAYCPHCDGPFYKGKRVAVIGGGNSGVEAAIDLAGIVREVVLFEYNAQLKADDILVKKLKSLPNTKIVTSVRTHEIHGPEGKVSAIEYEDLQTKQHERMELDGVFIQIGLLPNSQLVKEIVDVNKYGEIIIDPKGRTSVPGIYAAGDVTTVPYKQIVIALGEGAKAALAAFEDLMFH